MTTQMLVALRKHPLPWRVNDVHRHIIVDAKGSIIFTGGMMDQTAIVWAACVCRLVNEMLHQDDNK